METAILNLRNLFDQLVCQAEILNENSEYRKWSVFMGVMQVNLVSHPQMLEIQINIFEGSFLLCNFLER